MQTITLCRVFVCFYFGQKSKGAERMKSILYDKSEAVAALNRVEGFNPVELARRLEKEGQEDQLYLDVKYRKLWFRLVYPMGVVSQNKVPVSCTKTANYYISSIMMSLCTCL